ncbi:DNA internalization-related competence protein ComEC/Rec2 [Lactococcus nasutitermitis]|uniref:DNA internalization-related competence protein ComEC/Rec2 n=2 Tax=Lactococcus nasutitermitis TaxID=1652957 RepID=A0ABV9JBD3_9LACT|nr:DNA internalization-related competence protein ComEC/Rec2 [Lactococcus nasutitermitis]
MLVDLATKRLQRLRIASHLIKKLSFSPIFLVYLSTLLYFCIFHFSWLLLILFIFSFVLTVHRKYYLIIPLLAILAGIFFSIQNSEKNTAMNQPESVTQLTIIPDTISVNGDLLSFQGTFSGKKFQTYYTIKTQQEQSYFQHLTKKCQISFTGKVTLPENQRNFNGFNDQKYLATQNIYRQITIESIQKIQTNNTVTPQSLRRQAIVFSQQHFPHPMSNYMTGLLFGYLDKNFEQMGDIYSSLGIIHLFALSGAQVNFFIDWFRKILLRLGLRQDYVKLLQLPFSIFYAFMTGMSISVIRALLQKNLPARGLTNFSLTFFLLFIVNSNFLLTIGGQLTMLYAFIISMISGKLKKLPKLKMLLAESTIISLGVLPLLIFDFHIFQPLSILLTFAFSFLFDTILLPLLLLSFILAHLNIIIPANTLFHLLENLVKSVDSLVHYPPVFGTPNQIEFILLFVLIGLFIDYIYHKKIRIFLFLSLIILFIVCKNPLQASITAVDVGQGDSIFLQDSFNKQTILIDTGGRVSFGSNQPWQQSQTSANADKTLIPYLKSEGVSTINHLILTHTDDDHVGDFVELASKIKIQEVDVSSGELTCPDFIDKLQKAKVPYHIIKVGDKFPIFHSQLQILSSGYTKKGDNNDSIVTYGNFYGQRFLFTGDLEQDGEKELLKNYPTLKVDVLKAGHHGSKTSSNPTFIKKIQPKLTLISVGKNNRYGHPNQETLNTFKKYHVASLRTDQHGAIKLTMKNKQWHISTVK